jgi:NAD dependent epimerase/dehydratase family enzyme
VLSHLVFWQREYVVITDALVNGCSPHLRQSTFVALNARSVREYRQRSLTVLCHDFLKLQQTFTENLQKLPDWEIEFPIKKGCRRTSVAERLPMILEHIDGHLTRLKNAQRHGEAWVNAYYPTRNHAHN